MKKLLTALFLILYLTSFCQKDSILLFNKHRYQILQKAFKAGGQDSVLKLEEQYDTLRDTYFGIIKRELDENNFWDTISKVLDHIEDSTFESATHKEDLQMMALKEKGLKIIKRQRFYSLKSKYK